MNNNKLPHKTISFTYGTLHLIDHINPDRKSNSWTQSINSKLMPAQSKKRTGSCYIFLFIVIIYTVEIWFLGKQYTLLLHILINSTKGNFA